MSQVDWLSYLLKMIAITGRLEVRRAYGAPWRVALSPGASVRFHLRFLVVIGELREQK